MYDVTIIGAGAMGSAAAYYTAKTGKKVLLLEQFKFLHRDGSSHGNSRIIRKSYVEDYFINLMHHAYELWDQVQDEAGQRVIVRTGGLDFGPSKDDYYRRTLLAAQKTKLPHEELDAEGIRLKFPMLKVGENFVGIYQEEAGIIDATRAVEMFQTQAKKHGAELKDQTEVVDIEDRGNYVAIRTTNGEFQTKKTIVTAGPWINNLLEPYNFALKSKVWQLTYAFFKIQDQEQLFHHSKFPIFIYMDGPIFYGVGVHEKPGYLKIGPHFTSDMFDKMGEKHQPSRELISKVSDFVKARFKWVDPTPVDIDTCLYNMTSDENFIIDFFDPFGQGSKNIVIGAGFSGHGFKFTPLIGRILSDLAIDEYTNYDISKFTIKQNLAK
ncbi:MAG: N-methyl-L-tryptophan oxidase [Candidatus Heimdallarchaeota archaeon]|nr:N-methyl-L-tryptophan oxidase [Candidatus Heimdallarchaeota archaeon]